MSDDTRLSACSLSWQSMASLAAEISESGRTAIDVEPCSDVMLMVSLGAGSDAATLLM